MKKKIIIITLMLFILFTTIVNANTLVLNMKANRNNIKVGDTFKITLDWKQKMQAADFILNYDTNSLEFIGMNIGENFYKVELGKVDVAWVALDEIDKTNLEFEFKAIKDGKTSLSTQTNVFADANVDIPDEYKEGAINLKIKPNNGIPIYLWIILLVVIAIIIRIYIMKKKKKNRKR